MLSCVKHRPLFFTAGILTHRHKSTGVHSFFPKAVVSHFSATHTGC